MAIHGTPESGPLWPYNDQPFAEPQAMHFNILGPLQVVLDGEQVALRGIKQRATLGFLLLRINRAVATSQLIKALWQAETPPTARKMLQNAVAGVRAVLARDRATHPTRLRTLAPGYLLDAPPERVDLCLFQELAATGRSRLIEGSYDSAARTLHRALELWRGPALADLTESGIDWPEIVALQNARLAVVEDYAEAELGMNHCQEVVACLERVLADDDQPPRERLSSLLMIALYRSGRQGDALSVYQRTRSALIEQLGLDPSRDLQSLERAILEHDPALAQASGVELRPVASLVKTEESTIVTDPGVPAVDDVPAVAERKTVTVLLLRTQVDGQARHDPEDLNEARRAFTAAADQIVRQYGGSLRDDPVGSLWTVRFGVPHTREDDADRAVHAALELQRHLLSPGTGQENPVRLIPQIALATGEALVSRRSVGGGTCHEVTGNVFDTALRLLTSVPPGELRVCDQTRAISARSFRYARAAEPDGGWRVVETVAEEGGTPFSVSVPLVERTQELQVLRVLLDDVRLKRRAHLVTLLGEPGIGKSRLIGEFRRTLAASGRSADPAEQVLCVSARTPAFGTQPVRAVLGDLVRSLAASGLLGGRAEDLPADADVSEIRAASLLMIEDVAVHRVLVIVIEDLHWADDELVDFLQDLLLHAASLPLFIIVSARPELLEHRPHWGGGTGSATTITLDPLSDEGIERLLGHLRGRPGPGGSGNGSTSSSGRGLPAELISWVGGNPLFALEYVRHLDGAGHDPAGPTPTGLTPAGPAPTGHVNGAHMTANGRPAGEPSLPSVIRQVIAAWLDTLPPKDKAVLQDAAVIGQEVCPASVAAVSALEAAEVADHLRRLERRELLRRKPYRLASGRTDYTYVFRHAAVRAVAYAQLPRAVRADKHHRAAVWLERRSGSPIEAVAYHYRNALELSEAAGKSIGGLADRARQVLSAAEKSGRVTGCEVGRGG